MTINIAGFLKFFFWIRLVPVRKKRNTTSHLQKNIEDVEQQDSEADAWEWDLCSARLWLLMLAMLVAYGGYIFFTVSHMVNNNQVSLFNISVLAFKLLTMTTSVFIPWMLGPAACQLGSVALPKRLTISHFELSAAMIPIFTLILGLLCIHVHELADKPWGVIPVAFSALLDSLAFLGMLSLFYAWLYDFRQEARAVGSQLAITADQADDVLAWFSQLKNATGNTLFLLLVLCQMIQIFSSYNIFSG
jgi:hypothetical protein